MKLRPELMSPEIDENLVTRLAELANKIDGAAPGAWDGGRTIDEYDPTPEEIVDLALRVDDNAADV
ncbi:MAG: hypothetical protein JXM70_15470 [Pirellulales bacterium]|nr:hypothetical protein [Pirellulales bacterium]